MKTSHFSKSLKTDLYSSPLSDELNRIFRKMVKGFGLKPCNVESGRRYDIDIKPKIPVFTHGPKGWQLAFRFHYTVDKNTKKPIKCSEWVTIDAHEDIWHRDPLDTWVNGGLEWFTHIIKAKNKSNQKILNEVEAILSFAAMNKKPEHREMMTMIFEQTQFSIPKKDVAKFLKNHEEFNQHKKSLPVQKVSG